MKHLLTPQEQPTPLDIVLQISSCDLYLYVSVDIDLRLRLSEVFIITDARCTSRYRTGYAELITSYAPSLRALSVFRSVPQ